MSANYKVFTENNEVVFKRTTGSEAEFRYPANSYLTASVVNTTKIKIAKADGANLFYNEPYASFKDASGTALGASASATVTALNAVFDVPPAENFIVKDENTDLSGTTKIRHKEGTGGEDRDEGGTLELDLHSASIGLYGSYIKITEEDLNNNSGKDGAYGRLQLFLENAGSPVDVLDMQMGSLVQAPAVDLNTSSLDVSGDVTFSSAAGTVTFSGNTSGIDYNDLSNIPAGGVSTTIHYARMSMSSAVLNGGASQQNFTSATDIDVQFDTEDDVNGTDITTNTATYSMTVSTAGYYRLTCNMSFYSTAARITPGIRFNVNGNNIPGESMGYIRAANGQNENTNNLTRVIELAANDEVQVCAHDESNVSGAVYAEEAIFEVEKLEVSIDADFDNITNTPTTLAGYGITDSLQLGTTSTTALAGDTTTITSSQASAITANTAKTSFPGFGTIAGTALEGNTALFDGAYSSLTGVPSTFAPSSHTHTHNDITDFDTAVNGLIQDTNLQDLNDVNISSIASGEILKWDGSEWINATLGQAGIAATSDVFSGAYVDLTGIPSTFTPSAHTHTASEITDFDTEVSNNSSVTANTAKTSFPGFGTTAGTALEGDTVIENNHLIGQQLEFETKGSSYSQGWEGEIVKYGTATLQANKVYNYTSSGWIASRATSDTNTKGLIGIALGSDADVDGVLVKGIYTSTSWSGFSAGDILYLSTTSGVMTSTAPTASGAFVRVLGYALGSNTIYINPSPDYIEIA